MFSEGERDINSQLKFSARLGFLNIHEVMFRSFGLVGIPYQEPLERDLIGINNDA